MRTQLLDRSLAAAEDDGNVTRAEGDAILTAARHHGVTAREVTRLRAWLDGYEGTLSPTARSRIEATIARGPTVPSRAAPARDISYDRLTADGRVEIGLAVGYDDGGVHLDKLEMVDERLRELGFTLIDPSNTRLLRAAGVMSPDPSCEYYVRLDARGEPMRYHSLSDSTVTITLLRPGAARDASRGESLRRLFATSEVFAYTGHGRYGSGPDMDSIDSAGGNFRIGAPYEEGHVALPRADHLAAPEMMRLSYQLAFFSGCTTDQYVRSLRRHGLSRADRDVLVTNQLVGSYDGARAALEFLGGVIDGRGLAPTLDALDGEFDEEGLVQPDGFGDVVAPRPVLHE